MSMYIAVFNDKEIETIEKSIKNLIKQKRAEGFSWADIKYHFDNMYMIAESSISIEEDIEKEEKWYGIQYNTTEFEGV